VGRGWAVGGFVCTAAGFVLLAVSVVATRRLWFSGFVSEAGIGASAGPYRVGLWFAGAGLVLLAVALAGEVLGAAGLLAGAGVCSALSATFTCTAGCPLPPYEATTAADLLHAAVSILAIGAVALAMLAVAAWGRDPSLRRVSRVGAVVVLPLVTAVGIALLAVGRGQITGVLERVVLVGVTAWTLAMCLTAARRARPPSP
jgi:hypothetical protein